MATASELVTKISFVGSLAPLDKLNTGLTTSIKTIGAVGVAYGAMGLALNAWVDNQLEATYQTSNFAKELGVSIEAMQEWGYIAKMNGSSAEAVQSSMSSLSEKMGEFAKFDSGEGKEVFESLGIAVKDSEGKIKSADLVMRDLANSMQGMSASEQKSITAKLGIDESMLQTLRLTNDQFEHLRDRARGLGIVTEEQAEQVRKYKQSLGELGFGLNSIKTQLAIAFAPALIETSDAFTDLLANNRELIDKGLSSAVSTMTTFASALVNVGKGIYDTVASSSLLSSIIGVLIARVLFLNKALLLNPIGLVTGAIILAIGVIDDLVVAFEGGESVIADFFASFNIDIVKTLTGAFNILEGTWKGMVSTVLRLSESIYALFTLLEEGGKYIGIDFDLNFEEKYKKTKALADKYSQESKDLISGAFAGGIKVDDSKGFGTLNDNALLPNSVTNSNVATNNNTQNNNIKIEVKADNPQQTAQVINDSLKTQISDASKQFNAGGR
ncbi:phage tail tape measure protein [Aliarcobacter cryaerophilus]|uniref:phage tail tape measure protein n=1 Tax=Aliarcobacter cryaerophilus TaxID=28198 RepID=UPI00082450CD|nr:phage tail tape measure protein [Aliarcobacter cryaerophilus]